MLRKELIEQPDPLVRTRQQKLMAQASNDVHWVEFLNLQFVPHIPIDLGGRVASNVTSQPMRATRHATEFSEILSLEESAQAVSASESYAIDLDMCSVVGWKHFLRTQSVQNFREQGLEHGAEEDSPIQRKAAQGFRRNAAVVAHPS